MCWYYYFYDYMTIDDIMNLVSADESRTLELKKSTGELKDGMHSACAFLNTEGGWLIFGVAPSSLKIIGQEVTDKTKQEIGVSRNLSQLNFYWAKITGDEESECMPMSAAAHAASPRMSQKKESITFVILSFAWCHQLFNRVIEWWCTGIYIFILRGLKENLHVNLQKLFWVATKCDQIQDATL